MVHEHGRAESAAAFVRQQDKQPACIPRDVHILNALQLDTPHTATNARLLWLLRRPVYFRTVGVGPLDAEDGGDTDVVPDAPEGDASK